MTRKTEINSGLPLRHPTSASSTNDHSSAPGMVRMTDLFATLDAQNIEGREVTGNAVIIECTLVETHLLEVGVKNVNPAATEVRGKKKMLPVNLGEGRSLCKRPRCLGQALGNDLWI
jgi:hypothetical protein